MAAENIVFGETVVPSRPGSGYASPEEILGIGRRIWRRIEESGVSPRDDAGNDKLLAAIQTEFPDFTTTFPLVVRWAVQLRKYSTSALEKFLRLHSSADLSSRESFIKLQAEYLVVLFREENSKRHDEKAVQSFRTEITRQLLEEDKSFQELQKAAEKEAAEQAASVDAERRQKLFQFLCAARLSQKAKEEAGSL